MKAGMLLKMGWTVVIELLLKRGIEKSEKALRFLRCHRKGRMYLRDEGLPTQSHGCLHLRGQWRRGQCVICLPLREKRPSVESVEFMGMASFTVCLTSSLVLGHNREITLHLIVRK